MEATEQARLRALRSYKILDTDPDKAFDDLTILAYLLDSDRADQSYRLRSPMVQVASRRRYRRNASRACVLR